MIRPKLEFFQDVAGTIPAINDGDRVAIVRGIAVRDGKPVDGVNPDPETQPRMRGGYPYFDLPYQRVYSADERDDS
jgi:hypothetical protein